MVCNDTVMQCYVMLYIYVHMGKHQRISMDSVHGVSVSVTSVSFCEAALKELTKVLACTSGAA